MSTSATTVTAATTATIANSTTATTATATTTASLDPKTTFQALATSIIKESTEKRDYEVHLSILREVYQGECDAFKRYELAILKSILKRAGSLDFKGAFGELFSVRHYGEFSYYYHLLPKILNHLKQNHPAYYMQAFQAAVENAVYLMCSRKNLLSPILTDFLQQESNINAADQKQFFNLIIYCAVACVKMSSYSAEALRGNDQLVGDRVANFRRNPRGYHVENWMLDLLDSDLYYHQSLYFPLRDLYDDAKKFLKTILNFMLSHLRKKHNNNLTNKIIRDEILEHNLTSELEKNLEIDNRDILCGMLISAEIRHRMAIEKPLPKASKPPKSKDAAAKVEVETATAAKSATAIAASATLATATGSATAPAIASAKSVAPAKEQSANTDTGIVAMEGSYVLVNTAAGSTVTTAQPILPMAIAAVANAPTLNTLCQASSKAAGTSATADNNVADNAAEDDIKNPWEMI